MSSASTNRHVPGWLTALVLAAVGLWCSQSLLDLVRWDGSVVRVAMLAPWWLLASLVIVLGAIALVAARSGKDPDVVRPLCALGLLAVPYLPWLPDWLPVLRAAAGPARFLLWPIVFWLVAASGFGCRPSGDLGRHLGRSLGRWGLHARIARAPLAVFLASAIVFAVVAWRMIGTPLFPGGDEPHYLVITQSLLRDGDLKIENNHQRGDYHEYFNQPLKPDYLALGADGQIYSVHPVGMPILAIPAFALGGYRGVVTMMILMAALAATLMWKWAYAFTASAQAATFGWAAVAITAPFLFNSFTVYPEIPGALAVMVALAWRTETTTIGVLLLRGAAIGALPWLSTKYAPMAAALTMVLAVRVGWRRPLPGRAIAALVTPVVVAFAGWFAFFFWIWGTVSPSAPYGLSQSMTLISLAHGGPGLLFDQEYGIVSAAPVLIVAILGLAHMGRKRGDQARTALELTLTFAALWVTVGAFRLWWGGEASVGRPLASGVLLLGLPIAAFYSSAADRPAVRATLHVLLAVSLAMAAAMAAGPDGLLLHQDRDGTSVLIDWASPTWPLSSAFPSFIVGPLLGAIARTVAWLAVGTLVAWMLRLRRPRTFGAAALAATTLGVAGTVAAASLITHPRALPVSVALEARSRVPLLDRFDRARRPTTVLYNPLSRITAADALARVALVARPGLRTDPEPLDPLWNARFALPAGEYLLRFTTTGAAVPPDFTLALQVGRAGPPMEHWNITGPRWEHRFILPVDADYVGILAPVSPTTGELRLTPVTVVDQGSRLARAPSTGTQRDGEVTAFFHGSNVFPEADAYWTRGGSTAEVTYAIGAGSLATAVDVVTHCGPVRNELTLSTPGWSERLTLEPGASRAIAIPTMAQAELGLRIAPVSIAVRSGFVPATVDRTSTDRRFLGCWIELARQRQQ